MYVMQNGSSNLKDFDFYIKILLGLQVLSTIDTWNCAISHWVCYIL